MQGGMMMLGDMFNHALKGRVDGLCQAISGLLASQPGLLQTGSFQSQSQGADTHQHQASGISMGASSLLVPDRSVHWWPSDLGSPSATGSQNHVRYAYFAHARRLAVETGEDIWVYDTQDHQIGGFSQQQGMRSSILFTSQHGILNLSSLSVVSRNGQPIAAGSAGSAPKARTETGSGTPPAIAQGTDIFTAIERLGDLQAKGILTSEEFATKKAELLSRL
ncbi:SHOCT domain-containing protein [Gammaproteobacteria bacterium]